MRSLGWYVGCCCVGRVGGWVVEALSCCAILRNRTRLAAALDGWGERERGGSLDRKFRVGGCDWMDTTYVGY